MFEMRRAVTRRNEHRGGSSFGSWRSVRQGGTPGWKGEGVDTDPETPIISCACGLARLSGRPADILMLEQLPRVDSRGSSAGRFFRIEPSLGFSRNARGETLDKGPSRPASSRKPVQIRSAGRALPPGLLILRESWKHEANVSAQSHQEKAVSRLSRADEDPLGARHLEPPAR